MAGYPCPICGDPRGFLFWFDDEPPAGCPQDKSWHDGGAPQIRNVTECRYQMAKAWQAAEFRRLVPDAFDENGKIKPGGETLGRVLKAFHAAHPTKTLVI